MAVAVRHRDPERFGQFGPTTRTGHRLGAWLGPWPGQIVWLTRHRHIVADHEWVKTWTASSGESTIKPPLFRESAEDACPLAAHVT